MLEPIKHIIYLIDDDDSVRNSFKNVLELLGYEVHPFSSAMEFIALEDLYWPAILISDVRMPKMSGIQLQSILLERGIKIPIIFISGESTVDEAIQGLKKGGFDFFLKPLQMDDFLSSIVKTFEKLILEHKESHRLLTRDCRLERLAPREREVCDLIAKGHTNIEIGQILSIKADTAKKYKSQIFDKLNLTSVSELIQFMKSS